MFAIKYYEERLSDGSVVHNVRLIDTNDDGDGLIFHCMSERDAESVVNRLETTINFHAVDSCKVIDW